MSAPKETDKIAVFKGREVRRVLIEGKWWFSVVDVVSVLTGSNNPRDYWYKMKAREKEESEIELSTICRQLKLRSSDGKFYQTDCADTEGIFRIIQSIPSSKAEPFKRWLARDFALEDKLGGSTSFTADRKEEIGIAENAAK